MVNMSQWRNLVARCYNMMLVSLNIVHEGKMYSTNKREANVTGMTKFMVEFKWFNLNYFKNGVYSPASSRRFLVNFALIMAETCLFSSPLLLLERQWQHNYWDTVLQSKLMLTNSFNNLNSLTRLLNETRTWPHSAIMSPKRNPSKV
jgi:hypothetical protein